MLCGRADRGVGGTGMEEGRKLRSTFLHFLNLSCTISRCLPLSSTILICYEGRARAFPAALSKSTLS